MEELQGQPQDLLGTGSLPIALQRCLTAAAVTAAHGSLPALGSYTGAEPLSYWAVACWEATPGIGEMGSKREPEQTLKGGLSEMMV